MAGRYGPYVKWDKINATLPKDKPQDALTLQEALVLLAEKAAKGPVKGRKKAPAKKKPAAKKAPAKKKAPARKPAAKKAPAKSEAE